LPIYITDWLIYSSIMNISSDPHILDNFREAYIVCTCKERTFTILTANCKAAVTKVNTGHRAGIKPIAFRDSTAIGRISEVLK